MSKDDNRISFISPILVKDFKDRCIAFRDADLARSGLTTDDIPTELEETPGVVGPCYRILYFQPDGTPIPEMWRQRNSDGKNKYLAPSREQVGDICNMPYFCPLRLTRRHRNGLYVIVEGEKKYAKLLKETGLYGCAIGGKDNWRDGEGVLHPMLYADIAASIPERILIVPDSDFRRQDIFSSYSLLVFTLQRRFPGVRVEVADISMHRTSDDRRMGIDDFLVAGLKWDDVPLVNLENELLLSARVLVERYALDYDQNAKTGVITIRNNHSNVEKLLRNHPMFGPEALWFNMDDDKPVFMDSMENTSVRLTISMQRFCHMPKIGMDVVWKTAPVVFGERVRSPLLEHIKSFKWDGEDHIKAAATEGFETDREHERYREEAIRRLFLQAVARKDKPGCRTDTVLVLVSDQGRHKSSLWEILSYGSLTIVVGDPNDRDQEMRIHSKWFAVFEEMEWPSKVDEEKYKRFVSQTEGHYRAPYAEAFITKPRTNVFVGNTNNETPLRGAENRREMPIRISNINLEWFKEHLDQLWAQAWSLYQAGERWWSDDESIWESDKDEYRESIPHEKAIMTILKLMLADKGNHVEVKGQRGIEMSELLHAIQNDIRGFVGPKLMGNWLKRLGWEMRRVRVEGGNPQNLWFKK